MDETDSPAPDPVPAAAPVAAAPAHAAEVFSGAAPQVPAVPKPVQPLIQALPAPETASYRVIYGMLGQVAEASISLTPGMQQRTVHAVGRGNGAVLGFAQMEKQIESDFDLQTLKTLRWTITRVTGKETVTDIAEQPELGKVSLVRKRPGKPDEVDTFTRATAVLDPLGLLMRLRFGPMSAPSSFELLDGHALWVITFSSIRPTSETPPTLQFNGHVEPIYWDGTPDKERTGRDFSLFLSNDSTRTPVRMIVPFGLGHARAEIIQLSRTGAEWRVGMAPPEGDASWGEGSRQGLSPWQLAKAAPDDEGITSWRDRWIWIHFGTGPRSDVLQAHEQRSCGDHHGRGGCL
jgi:hypothetical protein